MSPEAERDIKLLLRVQQEQYRFQTIKASFAGDLVFKVLPFVAMFAFLAIVVDSWMGGSR